MARKGGKKKNKPSKSQLRPGHSPPSTKRAHESFACMFLSILLSITAITLGVLVLTGCMSKTMKSLYVAEIGTNATSNIQLGVGYFGGCITMDNETQGANQSSQTYCLKNMGAIDIDDLSEEFSERLTLTTVTEGNLKTFLNETLPSVRHLQKDVFPFAPAIAHVILFTISSIMLLVAVPNPSANRQWKLMLVVAVLSGGFALALVFLTNLGSLQALNALLDGNNSKDAQVLRDGIYIFRADLLYKVQAVQLSAVALFFALLGYRFIFSR